MPWRKYTSRKGKNGPIYHIQNGIQVRLNSQKKWILFIEIDGKRKNKTIGSGREGLVKAIKAAEAISSQLEPKATLNTWSQAQQVQQGSHPNQYVPKFLDYSKRWLENNAGRWDDQTYERYEGILRLHIWPNQAFQDKTLDEINRNTIKNFLRGFLNIRSAKSVELAQIILYGIFDEAIDDEIVEANPASRVLKKVLPVDKNRRKVNEAEPFDLEERDLFIETACRISTCTWAEPLVLKVMAFAGFRLGETLAMRAENFDFHSMSYHITQSYKLHKFRKPKKGKKRFVDLADFLADEFQQYVFHLRVNIDHL